MSSKQGLNIIAIERVTEVAGQCGSVEFDHVTRATDAGDVLDKTVAKFHARRVGFEGTGKYPRTATERQHDFRGSVGAHYAPAGEAVWVGGCVASAEGRTQGACPSNKAGPRP